MNLETIPKAIEAGANSIVIANAIFGDNGNVKENIEKLKKCYPMNK